MNCRASRMLTGIILMGFLALSVQVAAQSGKDTVTLTLRGTCSGNFSHVEDGYSYKDKVTVSFQDSIVYRIVDGDQLDPLSLEMISHKNSYSVSGGGAEHSVIGNPS